MTNLLQNRHDILQERFALKAASYLSASAADLPYEISERLRAARVQALAKRKAGKTQAAGGAVNAGGGSAALLWGNSGDGLGWWGRIGSFVPLIALVVGMLTINVVQNDNRAQELAEVDAALLIDDLPPAAFTDPGFLQFLKTSR